MYSEKVVKRFWNNTVKIPFSDCLYWIGTTDTHGYGNIRINNRTRLAHRVAWEIYNKSLIPSELCIIHSCDNVLCVKDSHIRVGSQRENVHDMVRKKRHFNNKKTHCKNGHEFSIGNTKIVVINNSKKRRCRKCLNRRTAIWKKQQYNSNIIFKNKTDSRNKRNARLRRLKLEIKNSTQG